MVSMNAGERWCRRSCPRQVFRLVEPLTDGQGWVLQLEGTQIRLPVGAQQLLEGFARLAEADEPRPSSLPDVGVASFPVASSVFTR